MSYRFVQWPRDALLSVSQTFFDRVGSLDEHQKSSLSSLCVEIHMSVNDMAEK